MNLRQLFLLSLVLSLVGVPPILNASAADALNRHQVRLDTLNQLAEAFRNHDVDIVRFMEGSRDLPGHDFDIAQELGWMASAVRDDVELAETMINIRDGMCAHDREHLSPMIRTTHNAILRRLDLDADAIGRYMALIKSPALVSLGENIRRDIRQLRGAVQPLVNER